MGGLIDALTWVIISILVILMGWWVRQLVFIIDVGAHCLRRWRGSLLACRLMDLSVTSPRHQLVIDLSSWLGPPLLAGYGEEFLFGGTLSIRLLAAWQFPKLVFLITTRIIFNIGRQLSSFSCQFNFCLICLSSFMKNWNTNFRKK